MFLGLKDLNPDLFFDIDDSKIFIYLRDIENLPILTNILPMGAFGVDEKIPFTNLDFHTRIKVGEQYLLRDDYAVIKFGKIYLRGGIFLQEFSTIPKLVDIINTYSFGESEFPIEKFYEVGTPQALQDLYYIITLYFSSTYREIDESQLKQQYEILTDVDLSYNTFRIITKVSDFFFKAFIEYLGTTPGMIPFQSDFGTEIRDAIQRKNDLVRRTLVESEINYFITEFNDIYGNEVEVHEIKLMNEVTGDGGDTWVISIVAKIENEFIEFKLVK